MQRRLGCLAAILFSVNFCGAQTNPVDGDYDRLPDSLESALLEKFRPSFMVSGEECDSLPAQIASGEAVPHVFVRNGTIYGQATPRTPDHVELHYFHLWSRDCGRNGHRGDVEHVSALIRQEADGRWKARYWYAAAHEGTVCDRSMYARAQELQAIDNGPRVWISSGKHASYFSVELCNGGCGGDSCRTMRATPVLPIVNLGEPGAALNGAEWTSSSSLAWPLAEKMSPNFDAAVLAQLDVLPAQGPVRLSHGTPGMQRAIAVSNTTAGGLETAQGHTGNSLETARRKTGNALQRSYRVVKLWVRRSSGSL